MTYSNEVKKQILNNFLQNISCIADKDYQRRVWIEGRGPECDDFDETVNHFFDDGNPILSDVQNFNLTEKQAQLLKEFQTTFNSFVFDDERPYLPQEFIDIPEWTKITELAKEVLKAFDWKMPSSGYLC